MLLKSGREGIPCFPLEKQVYAGRENWPVSHRILQQWPVIGEIR